jgi:hypothetical protein
MLPKAESRVKIILTTSTSSAKHEVDFQQGQPKYQPECGGFHKKTLFLDSNAVIHSFAILPALVTSASSRAMEV